MLKELRSLGAWLTGPRDPQGQGSTPPPQRYLEPPTREDVLNAFRLILGRELGNESAIREHMRIKNFAELRRALLTSEEFKAIYKAIYPENWGHPSLEINRETLVFMHLQKTGGSSLRAMLDQQFPAKRRCPVRDDKLHCLSVAELGQYDFFSGHFDRHSLRFIPRNNIKTVALFREPRARLISFYRFLRSHPARDEFAGDALMRAANDLSVEDFFERPETRSHVGVYNHYMIAFGGSYAWFEHKRTSLSKLDFTRALAAAKMAIHDLTAIGITERFSESVELIWRTLKLGQPPRLETRYVTNELSEMDARFKSVDTVIMTPRLEELLAELILYDDELYRFALTEFEQRCAASKEI